MSVRSSVRVRARCGARLRVVCVVAALASAFAATATSAPPAYYPSGPQTNVDESALAGWTQCWSGLYNGTAVIATVLACPGDYLLLAGGPVGSTVFDVVAAAPRADVIFDTGTSNTPHNANGSGWYFSPTYSWGFAGLGDAISRTSCDTGGTNAALRLCWHTSAASIVGGWRSGTHTGLNGSTTYRRAVYTAAAATNPEPVTPTRMGYCLAGKFLDLEAGQPTNDPAYKGAAPAIFVQSKGITCDPPPAGYALRGTTTDADNVDARYDRYAPAG